MQKILGVDFDDTLFLNSYPQQYNQPNWPVIDYVKERQAEGWYIILITCRTHPKILNGAVLAALSVGIRFDAINENHPDLIAKWGDCRKIYCDESLDDKNVVVTPSSGSVLKASYQARIENEEAEEEVEGHEKTPQIVYISGKMRGLPNDGYDRFKEAEEYLKSIGCIPINPALLPKGMDPRKYMPICVHMIDAANCVYMLDGWEDSEGAGIEYCYAKCQGKYILYENGGHENAAN